ncbi:hypothetical protein L2E82_47084 [Cichorium intybus]|uniref:Uncharacterized protein n=1 Tax=Cichorium intybus TaxID=13427 RepID=A0ACB8YUI2_CICIN|nr:hypothetical protein L2E82_47084 [Cichorium intybus]
MASRPSGMHAGFYRLQLTLFHRNFLCRNGSDHVFDASHDYGACFHAMWQTEQTVKTPLSFDLPTIRAERVNGDVVIYATLELLSGRTSFNQIWQSGPISNEAPGAHPLGSKNRSSGCSSPVRLLQVPRRWFTAPLEKHSRSIKSGELGILMPIGVMVARYLKVFKVAHPAWFYIHIACQATAYSVGVAGWGTGLKLGNNSNGIM